MLHSQSTLDLFLRTLMLPQGGLKLAPTLDLCTNRINLRSRNIRGPYLIPLAESPIIILATIDFLYSNATFWKTLKLLTYMVTHSNRALILFFQDAV